MIFFSFFLHVFLTVLFRFCYPALTFSTERVCRPLRGFLGGSAARCAEGSRMKHVSSTMQLAFSDIGVPPGRGDKLVIYMYVYIYISLEKYIYRQHSLEFGCVVTCVSCHVMYVCRIQTYWRGYMARKWYRTIKKTICPKDKRLRRQFFESRVR